MNILFISAISHMAGSTYSVSYLATGLSERGHQVFLACPENSLLSQLIQNTKVQYLPVELNGKLDRKAIRQIAEIVRQHNIDLINAQSSIDRYITILARWYYHLPVRLVHTRRQLSKSIGILGQSRFYEKGTDKIVAVSEGVKASLVKIGIAPNHIKVIYNGTPLEKYASVDPEKVAVLRKQYGIREGDVVIGSVARLKEQHQILEALRYIDQKVKVIFVGIEAQPAYRPITDQFPVPHEIYYTGPRKNEEVLAYYGLFTMNILATTIEGLSQALLEAMAMGVPVIATRIGGNPELIQDGENGLLFDNNDIQTLTEHIKKLIREPELRKQLAERAKKTALVDFSIENTISHHEQFFGELISHHG